jgi:hypothetical protein
VNTLGLDSVVAHLLNSRKNADANKKYTNIDTKSDTKNTRFWIPQNIVLTGEANKTLISARRQHLDIEQWRLRLSRAVAQ